jgi:hypothetical protein
MGKTENSAGHLGAGECGTISLQRTAAGLILEHSGHERIACIPLPPQVKELGLETSPN